MNSQIVWCATKFIEENLQYKFRMCNGWSGILLLLHAFIGLRWTAVFTGLLCIIFFSCHSYWPGFCFGYFCFILKGNHSMCCLQFISHYFTYMSYTYLLLYLYIHYIMMCIYMSYTYTCAFLYPTLIYGGHIVAEGVIWFLCASKRSILMVN